MISTTAPSNPVALNPEQFLRRMTHTIRRSLQFETVLGAAATEVQQFLDIDRVKIYRFHPDESGLVIAEALRADRRLPCLKGLNFPADDIPSQTRQLFKEAEVRYVADVESRMIGQIRLPDPEREAEWTANWTYRDLSVCHAEYLLNMGVRASVVIPIFHADRLWGLFVAHHAEPYIISIEQLLVVQLFIDQLSLAISHTDLLTQAQERADREATISRISGLLDSLTTIELQSALEATVLAFQGSGGRLFMQSTGDPRFSMSSQSIALYQCGTQPTMPTESEWQSLEQTPEVQRHFQPANFQTVNFQTMKWAWAIDDLYAVEELRSWQSLFRATAIRGVLIVPLVIRQQIVGYLSIFRDEIETETLWAGRFNPDVRQDYPRQSFESWRQSKTGQVQAWQAMDVKLAQALGNQFSTAIEQYELHQKVQNLNANLENQVQQRTAELQQTLQDLQRTQSQLIQTEKMSSLGQLVAGVAHEINNPMNFIHGNLLHVSGYVEDLLTLLKLYQQHYPDPAAAIQAQSEEADLDFIVADLPRTITSMKVGTERICQIILSLRNFSRLDQSEMKFVDIHEGIDSTLLILQHRFKCKLGVPEIYLVKDYGELPEVECYAGQLNQVFMNIISNAIDALEEEEEERSSTELSTEPKKIHIQTELVHSDHVQIRIADNGKGIPEHLRSRIFDPFFTTKLLGKGTGLGLSISYQIIVDKHRGSLHCASTPENGTEFIIEIPLRQIA